MVGYDRNRAIATMRRWSRPLDLGFSPSQWERRVYGVKKAAEAVSKASRVTRDVARKVSPYIPKGKSSLVRKMGGLGNGGAKRVGAVRGPKRNVNQLEGQTISLGKTNYINIGGKGQIKRLPKAINPLWHKYMFSMTRADRGIIGDPQGNNLLECVNNGGPVPLHCFELTQLPLQSNPQSGFMGKFNENGQWTLVDQSYAMKDAESGVGTSDTVNRCTTWLHHKSKIRLLLYGRDKQSTNYQIIFFRVKSEEACPLLDSTVVSANNNTNLQRTIWFKRLAKYTTTPVHIGYDQNYFRGDTKGDIQVLRTFNYHIKEKLGTEDAINKVNVNFTAYINKIKKHIWNQGIIPNDIDITGNVPQGAGFAYTNASKSPMPSQRIYMAIMATCYETSVEANYEPPSYDISIQHYASASTIHGWPN